MHHIFRRSMSFGNSRLGFVLFASVVLFIGLRNANASDHRDAPSVIADPSRDIGDVYAWTSVDGRRLNLVMTIVGHSFSSKAEYLFHIDSGARLGKTKATTTIGCRFAAADRADCWVGKADTARGDASGSDGLLGIHKRFRVFAGPRDDPFFNNVKGTRAAYDVATAALRTPVAVDGAGCPAFDRATSEGILAQWKQTDGKPGTDFLEGWTPASIVISVDLGVVTRGGRLLGVWGATVVAGKQADRAGRPLTGNSLLGTVAPDEVSDKMKEEYNAATPATSARFVPEIEKGLALYDAFDGNCGNAFLVTRAARPGARYRALAALLADDRLWVNSNSSVCTQLFAVERATLAGETALSKDCGGRTPTYDAVNVYRSLLVDGSSNSVDDGVHRKAREHSSSVFPFLAAPAAVALEAQGAKRPEKYQGR